MDGAGRAGGGRSVFVVVAYDVVEDRRRLKVARVLEDAGGRRANWSVFELEVDRSTLGLVRDRVAALIDPGTDSILYYTLCDACCRRADVQGRSRLEPPCGPKVV